MRRLLCFWCCLPCNGPHNWCVLPHKWYIILWCLIRCLFWGLADYLHVRFPLGIPRLISGEKWLPAMGALVRGKEPHLTVAVSPVNPALWTFSYLTKKPSLDSLELPACSGPVLGVNVFRTCAGLSWKGEKSCPGEFSPTWSYPGLTDKVSSYWTASPSPLEMFSCFFWSFWCNISHLG